MDKEYYTPEYMTRFSCLGPDCEDSCCTGWQVALSFEDHQRLSVCFANDKDNRRKDGLVLFPQWEDENNVGCLNFENGDACSFLDHGLCILHRDHGDAMLPKVCATFPRFFTELERHVEMHGLFACPEVVRLCLLSDASSDLVPLEMQTLPSIFETNVLGGEDVYETQLLRLRSVVMWILNQEPLSTGQKNFLLLYFCKRVSAYCYQGQDKDYHIQIEKLIKKVGSLDPKILRRFEKESPLKQEQKSMIIDIVNARFRAEKPHYYRLSEMVLRGLDELGEKKLAGESLSSEEVESIWQQYQNNKQRMMARFGPLITRYFRNYALNYWSQIFLKGIVSPEKAVYKYLLDSMMMQFMFFNHYDLREIDQEENEAYAQEQCDLTVVAVVQTYMKYISANHQLVDQILKAMKELNIGEMDDYVGFVQQLV